MKISILNTERLQNYFNNQNILQTLQADEPQFYDEMVFKHEEQKDLFKLYCVQSVIQWFLIDKRQQKTIHKTYQKMLKEPNVEIELETIRNAKNYHLIINSFPNKDKEIVQEMAQVIIYTEMHQQATAFIKKHFPFIFSCLPKMKLHEPIILIEEFMLRSEKFVKQAGIPKNEAKYNVLLFAALYWWSIATESLENDIDVLNASNYGIYHPDDISLNFPHGDFAKAILTLLKVTFNYHFQHNANKNQLKEHLDSIKKELGTTPNKSPYYQELPKNFKLIDYSDTSLGRPLNALNHLFGVCCDALSDPVINYAYTPFEETQRTVINEYFESSWQLKDKNGELQETYTKEEMYQTLHDALLYLSPLILDFNHAKKRFAKDIENKDASIHEIQNDLIQMQTENEKLHNQLTLANEKLECAFKENAQIESLRRKLAILESENNRLNALSKEQASRIHTLEKENQRVHKQIESNELNAFIQQINNNKTVILGGQNNWQQKMQTKLPNCIYYNPDDQHLIKDLSHTDLIIINTETLNHGIYQYVKSILPTNTMIIYVGNNTNPDINLQKIYEDFRLQTN